MLTSEETGADSTVTMQMNGADWGTQERVKAQDAEFTLNGIDIVSSSNYLDNVIDGVNIELMTQLSDQSMRIRINERGVGETQACGSGACAAAWAGHVLYGMSDRIQVEMPGGALTVVCDVNRDRISLIGPARYVYQGEIES